MKMKFYDTLGAFAQLIRELGIDGERTLTRSRHIQYRTLDGGVINWWPTTGTVNVQGKSPAQYKLRRKLAGALLSRVTESEVDPWDDDEEEDFDLEG